MKFDDNLSKQERLKLRQIQEAAKFKEAFKKGFKFFFENSAHIEIIMGNSIQKIDFIKLPYCNDLPKSLKLKFHDEVSIDSVKSKSKDLVAFAPQVVLTCRHEAK